MNTVYLLLIILLLVYAWSESLRMRDIVITHCNYLCREGDLQLLDQTVAMVSISLKKTGKKSLGVLRKYQFEVSENGVDRIPGFVTMLGDTVFESYLEGEDGINIFHQSKLH